MALAATSLLISRRAVSGTVSPKASARPHVPFLLVLQQVFDLEHRLLVDGRVFVGENPLDEIQLPVPAQTRPGKIARPDDGGKGPHAVVRLCGFTLS